jgi:hypothetical protein
MGVLAAGLPSALAFSTIEPTNAEPWQVHDLGYNLRTDIGGPANIGEDYRRNTPVLYYAFDENFLDFFGSNGVWAVDQAFAILNNLHNVSDTNYYSEDLHEVPLEARRFNQTAGALNLIDLKSEVLTLLLEQMGLADAVRFTWTLHDRTAAASCPVGNQYLVTKRNFDIVPSNLDQLQYSSYVNGVLFSYYIQEYCANPPGDTPLSEALEIGVDVPINANRFAPVSSWRLNYLVPGGFFTGLTRDDMAGLRYLLRSGHVHWEDSPANSIVFVTNNAPSALNLLVTSNLTLLAAQSLTNDDATLVGLYPGLAIVPGSTIPTFTNVVTTNVLFYFTNFPYDPVGTPQHEVFATNFTTNVMFVYTRAFANVVTNPAWYSPVSYVTVIDTNLYFPPYAPPGYFVTNTTTRTMLTNIPTGDFYILPPTNCGVQILSNVLTLAMSVTNTLVVTNFPTNEISGTYLMSRTYVSWWTNHNLAYFPVLCVSNEPSLRRGIEKITFVKTAYNSLLGASNTYAPQTNYFTMTTVTNATNWVQTFERVATVPDILFTAQDMMPGPAQPLDAGAQSRRSILWNQGNVLPGLGGPGVINSPTLITLNKSGPIYYNVVTNGNWFLDELTATQYPIWASYDDSTNPPVVYPNGTSIASLESQMLMQVTSVTLPTGQVGVGYTNQLTGTGGAGAPYIWSTVPNSPQPSGLTLNDPGNPDGRLIGIPTAPGIFSFFVQMTDRYNSALFTVWQVTLTVLP